MDGPLQCVTHIVFVERKSDRKIYFFVLVIGAYCSLSNLQKARSLITTNVEFIGKVKQA